jgi:hypothetical protein
LKPKVLEDFDISFKSVDEEGLLSFLCDVHEFSEERILNTIKKLKETGAEKKEKDFSLDRWLQ